MGYKKVLLSSALALGLSGAGLIASAEAAVVRITEAAFVAGSGLITFDEAGFPLGTTNPVYTPVDYGGGVGSPTVSFGGYFSGQMLGASTPPCPVGAALSGCVIGNPTGPLSLDPASPAAQIVTDGAFPTTPTLSGTPTFNGPIALLFDVDVAGVGLDGGFFNAIGGTAITAFGRDGSILGTVVNEALGIEFLGLVTDDGLAAIAGLQFSLVGPEPAGFNIDNVRFGIAGQVVVPPSNDIPEPSALLLIMGVGLVGAVAGAKKRRSA